VRLSPADTTGSGLGMAIVRQIAEQHHAPLALLDTPGGGLTVQVRLPVAPTSLKPLEIPTQSGA
jgi:signal transduction histidine kinase